MYYQYLPDIVKRIEEDDYVGVAEFLCLKSYHYLPFVCADIYQSLPEAMVVLTRLAAALATKENVLVTPGNLLPFIESLIDEWVTGSLSNQDAYDSVAQRLLSQARCNTVSFCAALLMRFDGEGDTKDEWNMFRLGLLAGAFVKNENRA